MPNQPVRRGSTRKLTEPHPRYDQLGGRWVLVSAQPTDRPWQGRVAERSRNVPAAHHLSRP